MGTLLINAWEFERVRKEIAAFACAGLLECIRALNIDEVRARALAAFALGSSGKKNAIGALESALEAEMDEGVRGSIGRAITNLEKFNSEPSGAMLGGESLVGWDGKDMDAADLDFAINFGNSGFRKSALCVTRFAAGIRVDTRSALEAVLAFERGKEIEGYSGKEGENLVLGLNEAMRMGHMDVKLLPKLNCSCGETAKIAIYRIKLVSERINRTRRLIRLFREKCAGKKKAYLEGKLDSGWGHVKMKANRPELHLVRARAPGM